MRETEKASQQLELTNTIRWIKNSNTFQIKRLYRVPLSTEKNYNGTINWEL